MDKNLVAKEIVKIAKLINCGDEQDPYWDNLKKSVDKEVGEIESSYKVFLNNILKLKNNKALSSLSMRRMVNLIDKIQDVYEINFEKQKDSF